MAIRSFSVRRSTTHNAVFVSLGVQVETKTRGSPEPKVTLRHQALVNDMSGVLGKIRCLQAVRTFAGDNVAEWAITLSAVGFNPRFDFRGDL